MSVACVSHHDCSGCEETTQLLVDAGADVNSKTVGGASPAMFCSNHHVLKVLLQKPNIDLSIQDENGNTALHYAVIYQRTANILMLLEAGADPHMLDFNLTTPLHMAVRMGYFS